MRKGKIFGRALLIAAISGVCIIYVNQIPAFAGVERSELESIDLHLEECIKQLQAGYLENGISHCKISEQELGALLENTTAPNPS